MLNIYQLLFVDTVPESYFEPQRPFFTRLPPRDKQRRPSGHSSPPRRPDLGTENASTAPEKTSPAPERTSRAPERTSRAPERTTTRVTEDTTPRLEDDSSGK